jgi:hypothetical protein
MNPAKFRELALALPEAVEAAHMGHPDFRVRGKIFATLGPDGSWGMVKLTPPQQQEFLSIAGDTFSSISGAWGRGGATKVTLRGAREASVKRALRIAWSNTAPRKLVEEHDGR